MTLYEEVKCEIAAAQLYERLEKEACAVFSDKVLQDTKTLLTDWGLQPTQQGRCFGISIEKVRLCVAVGEIGERKPGESKSISVRVYAPSLQDAIDRKNGLCVQYSERTTFEEFSSALQQRVVACIRTQLMSE